MPAPKTIFIPFSCFGYYDEKFEECTRKCRHCDACRNATNSDQRDEVRGIYKYKMSQIEELVERFGGRKRKETQRNQADSK